MPTINCNEKPLILIALMPYMTIFPCVFVLVVRSSGLKIFVPVEVFQFIVRELVNDTPNVFRLITQDVRHAASSSHRFTGKGQPM